jgi:nicotinate-nucleotide adenylyltransferase
MDIDDCHNIIVFGGSFDPPHVAHVELPMLVCRQLHADAVVYVPAARAPHKLDQQQTSAHHRLAMLHLALADVEHTIICTDEIDRAADGQPSYTVDTLKHLRRRLPTGAAMRLLIGTDQVRIFSTWKDRQQIAQLAEPLVMLRPPDTAASLLASLGDEAAQKVWQDRLVELPAMQISSTDLRRRSADDKPLGNSVHPDVARYIAEHNLYG